MVILDDSNDQGKAFSIEDPSDQWILVMLQNKQPWQIGIKIVCRSQFVEDINENQPRVGWTKVASICAYGSAKNKIKRWFVFLKTPDPFKKDTAKWDLDTFPSCIWGIYWKRGRERGARAWSEAHWMDNQEESRSQIEFKKKNSTLSFLRHQIRGYHEINLPSRSSEPAGEAPLYSISVMGMLHQSHLCAHSKVK